MAWVAKPPVEPIAATASPTFRWVTPSPSASIVPENSEPGTKGSGGFAWYLPCTIRMSGKFRLAARMAMRTSPGPGSGVGSSFQTRSSGPVSVSQNQACMRCPLVWRSDRHHREVRGAARDRRCARGAGERRRRLPTMRVHAYPDRERRWLSGPRTRGTGAGLRRARRNRRGGAGAERQRHLECADAEPAAVGLRGLGWHMSRAFASSTARHPTACTSHSPACCRIGRTWCCRASTTAPTWATTRSIRAPSRRRWKASCSAFRRSPFRRCRRAGATSTLRRPPHASSSTRCWPVACRRGRGC